MFNIRRSVFETNSSSTHSFTYKPNENNIIDEQLFRGFYTIKPYTSQDMPKESTECYDFKFETVESKLRYLMTCYYQAHGDDYEYTVDFVNRLKRLFPNTYFCEGTYDYVFEDCEYVMDNESPKDPLKVLSEMSDEELKLFFQYGVIYVGSRDDGIFCEFQDNLKPFEIAWISG